MGLKKAGVVRRVEQIPFGWPVVRDNFRDDRIASRWLVRIFGQSNVDVVVCAAEQVALNAFSVSFCERVVFINIRVLSFEDKPDKCDGLFFSQLAAVA